MTSGAQLLAHGEHAAFHGPPRAAIDLLEQAMVALPSQGGAQAVPHAAWLLGACLAAVGRFGAALTVLGPVVEAATADATLRPDGALCAAVIASVHRQLGRHAAAADADTGALTLSAGTGPGAFDALLGLASDAVGAGDAGTARERLDAAELLLEPGWWRQRLRGDWVRSELALLQGDPQAACAAAARAVQAADEAQAPRHAAKGRLLLGLAQLGAGQDAVSVLRDAAHRAEALGALPLVWPSRALLAALQPATEGIASRASARDAVLGIAADLPAGVRAAWLARPDLVALLQ